MDKQVLTINEAYGVLKEGLIIKDLFKTYFKLKKESIVIITNNARYVLTKDEFINLYYDSKFIIVDESDSSIDYLKDEEYYSFKHK